MGAITKGRKGEELAEIGGLVEGGAVAFTDDGSPVVSAEIMRRALEYCRMFGKAVLSHAEDLELTRGVLGRRTARLHPESSLIYLKGLGRVPCQPAKNSSSTGARASGATPCV